MSTPLVDATRVTRAADRHQTLQQRQQHRGASARAAGAAPTRLQPISHCFIPPTTTTPRYYRHQRLSNAGFLMDSAKNW